MPLRQPLLGVVLAVGVLVLSLMGAGIYLLLPLDRDDPWAEARAVAEEFVDAWAAGRCDDVAALVHGTAVEAERACRDSAARRHGELALEDLDLRLDGRRGTVDLHLVARDGEVEERSTVTQALVRRNGRWWVAWR